MWQLVPHPGVCVCLFGFIYVKHSLARAGDERNAILSLCLLVSVGRPCSCHPFCHLSFPLDMLDFCQLIYPVFIHPAESFLIPALFVAPVWRLRNASTCSITTEETGRLDQSRPYVCRKRPSHRHTQLLVPTQPN